MKKFIIFLLFWLLNTGILSNNLFSVGSNNYLNNSLKATASKVFVKQIIKLNKSALIIKLRSLCYDLNRILINTVNSVNRAGRTLLHEAETAQAVQNLVYLGADLSKKDFFGNTPLNYLVQNNRTEEAFELLKYLKYPKHDESNNYLGFNALSNAIILKHESLVNKIVKKFPHLIDNPVIWKSKETNCIYLALITSLNILKILLKKVNKSLNDISIPEPILLIGVKYNVELIKELFLDKSFSSVDFNVTYNAGYTLLMYAAMYQSEAVKLILNSKFITKKYVNTLNIINDSALNYAIIYQPLAIEYILLSGLLSKKAINSLNSKSKTSLMYCAKYCPQYFAKLLEFGADPNIVDSKGRTALDVLKKYNFEIFKNLNM